MLQINTAVAWLRQLPITRASYNLGKVRSSSLRGTQSFDTGIADGSFIVHGLSVSPTGFVALLRNSTGTCFAVPIDHEDSQTANSPEALTLLQLFQGIDMAGFLLPPDVLSVRYAEDRDLSIHYSGTNHSYATASPWLRARCSDQLPRIQLLKVSARQETTKDSNYYEPVFNLECARVAGDSLSTVSVRSPSPFEAVALSLRHKVDIELDALGSADFFSEAELQVRFPQWRSEADAAAQDARIKSCIKSTIETSRLEAALNIARDKGDRAAEKKIRAALRAIDGRSAASLPVVDGEGEDGPATNSISAAASASALAEAADENPNADEELSDQKFSLKNDDDDIQNDGDGIEI